MLYQSLTASCNIRGIGADTAPTPQGRRSDRTAMDLFGGLPDPVKGGRGGARAAACPRPRAVAAAATSTDGAGRQSRWPRPWEGEAISTEEVEASPLQKSSPDGSSVINKEGSRTNYEGSRTERPVDLLLLKRNKRETRTWPRS